MVILFDCMVVVVEFFNRSVFRGVFDGSLSNCRIMYVVIVMLFSDRINNI